jgi:hypothetical protein
VEPDGFYTPKHVGRTAQTAFTDQLHDLVTELRRESDTTWHTFRYSARPGTLLEVVQQAVETEPYDYVVIGAKKEGVNELFGNSAATLIRQYISPLNNWTRIAQKVHI